MSYTVKTFGCKVNTYDTSLIQKQLDHNDMSFQNESLFSNYHIVNTCAVTKTAVLESLRWIRKYKKNHPNTCIVVTGCGTQAELDYYSRHQDIDLVIANSHKNQIADILKNHSKKKYQNQNQPIVFHSNIFKNQHLGEGGQVESHHTRLFLKIQDGCNQFCTFCIIPFARGKSRSLSVSHLVEQIQSHHEKGVMEVVLTGVHIGDYFDASSNSDLTGLVKAILRQTRIPRIRLSSLEPIELTDELLSLYSDSRMCKHFHLSIQSASSKVLKDMKRKYTQKCVKNCLNQIEKRFPNSFIGMDMIVGFCGESQSDFEETYHLLRNSFWTKIHVFPYSVRPKTYALRRSDHQSSEVIKKRAFLLRHLSHQRYQEQAMRQIGEYKQVLVLKKDGISRDYWSVNIPSSNEKICSEHVVQLLSWNQKENKFIGKTIN